MLKNFKLHVVLISMFLVLPGLLALGSEIPKNIINQVSKDTPGFIFLNLEHISKSGLLDEILTDEDAIKDIEDFKNETGIDIRKHVKNVVVAFTKLGEVEEPELYAIINTSVSSRDIINYIQKKEKKDLKKFALEGLSYPAYSSFDGEKNKTDYIAFPRDNMIVFASALDPFKRGLNVIEGKEANLSASSELIKRLKTANLNYMLWGFFLFPDELKQTEDELTKNLVKNISHLLFGMSYEKQTLDIMFSIFTGNNKQAEELSQALMGFKQLGAMGLAEMPDAAAILNKIMIAAEKDASVIRLSITKDEIEKLKNSFPTGMEDEGFDKEVE